MWNEFLAMASAALTGALCFGRRGRVVWISPLVLLALCSLNGTWGVGLLGSLAAILLSDSSVRVKRISWVVAIAVLTTAVILLPSGQGRLLGAAEAIWMATRSGGAGVGWGEWSSVQAEAQRAVLAYDGIPEVWKSIAPYFGVAPSFPLHLLAESGLPGLALWFAALWLLLRGRSNRIRAALAIVLFTSAGTTPFQVFLSVDTTRRTTCDNALKDHRVLQATIESVQQVCPEIRWIEWAGSAYEKRGDFRKAEINYRLWHATYPRDVMPAFALSRLLAIEGRQLEASRWRKVAMEGYPANDRKAEALKFGAALGDARLLDLGIVSGKGVGLSP